MLHVKKKNVCHIASLGTRASLIINEGLLELGYEVYSDRDEYVINEKIVSEDKDLIKRFEESSYIFVGSDVLHNYKKYIDNTFDKYWSKVIWYDYKDGKDLDEFGLKAKAYFKRSIDPNDIKNNVFPIDFCCLKSYYLYPNEIKDINVACMFSNLPAHQKKRSNILNAIKMNESLLGDVCYGNNQGKEVRQGIATGHQDLLQYWKILSKSKIVFNAFPQNWDGDSRTWESLSSKALLFNDVSNILSDNPLIPDRHYIQYNASNIDSIKESINKAVYYLKHEHKRNQIALSGYNHAYKYHRPKNRVEFMINTFNSI